jgi:undecaprenyl diphosphate synthase
VSNSAKSTVPLHLGLILDGNRRWAKAQGLPTLKGHRKGYENLKTIGKAAIERGVKYVSAYVFSTENWNRSRDEVDYLMKLLLWVAKHEVSELNKENIRVRFLGSRERLNQDITQAIDNAEEKTKNNTAGTLALCLNYGGQQELVDAIKKIVASGSPPSEVSEKVVAANLYEPDIPAVDFIIRTSGEQRISNFMLWRAAYSELYFTDKFWPDFNENDLDKALAWYAKRYRRFGT